MREVAGPASTPPPLDREWPGLLGERGGTGGGAPFLPPGRSRRTAGRMQGAGRGDRREGGLSASLNWESAKDRRPPEQGSSRGGRGVMRGGGRGFHRRKLNPSQHDRMFC